MWCDLNGLVARALRARAAARRARSPRRHHAHDEHRARHPADRRVRRRRRASPICPRCRWWRPVAPGWEVDTDVVIADLEFNGAATRHRARATCCRRPSMHGGHWGTSRCSASRWSSTSCSPTPMRRAATRRCTSRRTACTAWALGGDNTGLMFDFFDAAEHGELDLEGIMGEFHPGQMELNMKYGPAHGCRRPSVHLQGDDPRAGGRARATASPTWVVRIPRWWAAVCTSTSRSSPVGGGPNAFDEPDAEYGLSSLARQCLGGLIAHHEAIAAMSAPPRSTATGG